MHWSLSLIKQDWRAVITPNSNSVNTPGGYTSNFRNAELPCSLQSIVRTTLRQGQEHLRDLANAENLSRACYWKQSGDLASICSVQSWWETNALMQKRATLRVLVICTF